MALRRHWVVVVVMLAASLLPAGEAFGRRRWSWTDAEVRQIKSRQETAVRDSSGFYCITAGSYDVRTDVSPRFAAEVSVFMDMLCDGYSRFVFDTLNVPQPAGRPSGRGVPSRTFARVATERTSAGRIPFPRKPVVVIYAREGDYRKRYNKGSGGVFVYRWNRRGKWTQFHIYTYCQTARQRDFRFFRYPTLMHEATHSMLQALAGKRHIPQWFNEGFAQLVECSEPRTFMRGEVRPYQGRYWRKKRLTKAGQGWYAHAPSLSKLMEIKAWNVDSMGEETRYRYAIAWSFLEYLFSTSDGRKELRTLLHRIILKKSKILGIKDSWHLEQGWHRYIKKSTK